ncbi:hypothetical protein CIK76_07120 [Glutamicibacter sp. BW80]|uniref:hypothetical protein n=1 Tax=unclassified Glutamicibacter TaxID=2627139 RepID=UPI000BB8D944|nr:hypothetical protein [Glutamicibacter sp. BW80]PCC29185.1 hypothetical protein CIK76_07120 [Glutamicibacter sp. BW80]
MNRGLLVLWINEFIALFWSYDTRMDEFASSLPNWAKLLVVIAPAATLVIAALVAVAAFGTLWLRLRVDHSDQWWKRVEYAVNLANKRDAPLAGEAHALLQLQVAPESPGVAGGPGEVIVHWVKARGFWKVPSKEKKYVRRLMERFLDLEMEIHIEDSPDENTGPPSTISSTDSMNFVEGDETR